MKKFTNIKLMVILLMVTISTQSCAKSGLVPEQTVQYVMFSERPGDEELSGPKGAYQDFDGDGLADVRDGGTRPFTANKDDYEIDKILYKIEIVRWDGIWGHPITGTGQFICVALGGSLSKIVPGKPIPVFAGNLLYTVSKDKYDRLQSNTNGWSTYVEGNIGR